MSCISAQPLNNGNIGDERFAHLTKSDTHTPNTSV